MLILCRGLISQGICVTVYKLISYRLFITWYVLQADRLVAITPMWKPKTNFCFSFFPSHFLLLSLSLPLCLSPFPFFLPLSFFSLSLSSLIYAFVLSLRLLLLPSSLLCSQSLSFISRSLFRSLSLSCISHCLSHSLCFSSPIFLLFAPPPPFSLSLSIYLSLFPLFLIIPICFSSEKT